MKFTSYHVRLATALQMFISLSTSNMATYTEADIQKISPYRDVQKWTTKTNVEIVNNLVRMCYSNGASVYTKLKGGQHGMLGNLMTAALYATVSGTDLNMPATPVLNIPSNTATSQILAL